MEDYSNPPSLRHKLKQSLCFSCCFRRRSRPPPPLDSPTSPSDDNPALIWVKTEGPHDHSLSEIKDKCRSLLGLSGVNHKRYSSADFRYDPLSYALNFEDGFESDDAAPLKTFSARLPPSPPLPAAVS
ncbi:UNVERIFIED_CONTAM: hypothetical protein Scaly_2034800 [Sesamum calycinum]|uniref:Uncharacterized protein n=1 Tax=Sesamum calycinum TaxID=2727403 RepID=A0AAW2N227_9LAMI